MAFPTEMQYIRKIVAKCRSASNYGNSHTFFEKVPPILGICDLSGLRRQLEGDANTAFHSF
jgi:hypothetical protein